MALKRLKEKGAIDYQARNMHIKRLRDAGWTYKELSEKFGLSITRLHQIVEMETINKQQGFR